MRKANKRLRPQHFKGDANEYVLHPTKGYRRLPRRTRLAMRRGEAKYEWFKRQGESLPINHNVKGSKK